MPTRKIYTNTIAQIGAKVLTALISIVMIKILTTYLDVAGYGLYSKIYNYLSIFAVIADLGLYTITVRELSANKDDPHMVEKIASNVLTLRTLSGALIIIFSLGIGFFIDGYNSPEAMIGIAIASVFTLFGLINSSLMSYLQSILRTEFSLVANTAGKLLTLGMIILFASAAWGATHTDRFTLVMIAGLAGNGLMTALTWWYTQRWHPVRF
jgi:O-antigen/teichoic acid export membrane protein